MSLLRSFNVRAHLASTKLGSLCHCSPVKRACRSWKMRESAGVRSQRPHTIQALFECLRHEVRWLIQNQKSLQCAHVILNKTLSFTCFDLPQVELQTESWSRQPCQPSIGRPSSGGAKGDWLEEVTVLKEMEQWLHFCTLLVRLCYNHKEIVYKKCCSPNFLFLFLHSFILSFVRSVCSISHWLSNTVYDATDDWSLHWPITLNAVC